MTDLGDTRKDKLCRNRKANASDSDRKFIRDQMKGVEYITPENFKRLAAQARTTKASFDLQVEELLRNANDPRCWFVKYLRVSEECTWRRVAEQCHDLWGGQWEPPSNQLMGMALCERAAFLLDEDPGAEPWN